MYEGKAKLTLDKLMNSTRRFDPARVTRTQQITINIKDIIPYFGTKSMLFRGDSISGSVDAHYITIISFYDIEYIQEEFKRGMMKFEGPNGEPIIADVPSYRKTPVRIYCSCADYYFTWAYPNLAKNAHYGRKPKPYRRVVPDSGLPRRNPTNIEGMCKHVINMINVLHGERFLGR